MLAKLRTAEAKTSKLMQEGRITAADATDPSEGLRLSFERQRSAEEVRLATLRLRKHAILRELFEYLPPPMKRDMHGCITAVTAATAHWDGLNHDWSNAGYWQPARGTWKAAVVDYGNTMRQGFGGLSKAASDCTLAGVPALTGDTLSNRLHHLDLIGSPALAARPARFRHFGGVGLCIPPGGVPRAQGHATVFGDHAIASPALQRLATRMSHDGDQLAAALATHTGEEKGYFVEGLNETRERVQQVLRLYPPVAARARALSVPPARVSDRTLPAPRRVSSFEH